LRLLLDEMFTAAIAKSLRAQGADVVAAQEMTRLRGLDDPSLFRAAQEERRAIVTENVGDFLDLDGLARERGRAHYGLIIVSPSARPRRRGAFAGALARALESFLSNHPDDERTSAIWWLQPAN
jgi:hypothetical protein